MNWILKGLVAIAFLATIVFFFVVGRYVDYSKNVRYFNGNVEVSERAKALHRELMIADWHSDNLLWDRNILQRHNRGHVDVPRLIEGNFSLQVFDAVVQSPKGQNYHSNTGDTDNLTLLCMANRWPIRTWLGLKDRTIYQAELLHKAAKKSEGKLRLVKSANDLEEYLESMQSNADQVAGLLSLEGLHALENDASNLDDLYDAGYRMMGLVHFFDNEVGGSSAGVNKGGLTPLGIEVLKAMESKKIIVDLAHASSALIQDVLQRASRPVVVSHGGVQGIKNSPRNLSDDELQAIKANGGIVGLGFWSEAAGGIKPSDIAKSIKYVVDQIGIDHISLGSDWDGSVVTYFDASQVILLTEALIEIGFSDEEIKKIMGGNQLKFLLEQLP